MSNKNKEQNSDLRKIFSTLLFGILLILMIALGSFLVLMFILYSI